MSTGAAHQIPGEIVPASRLVGKVSALMKAEPGDFRTSQVDLLDVRFEGIVGDEHSGLTRKSGGREPWYPRGTEMRNERQLSIVCADELSGIAEDLAIDRLEATWIGANIILEGFANLSMLPPRSLLFFDGGLVLKIDGQNAPCRVAGGAIAAHFPDRDADQLALDFVKAAKRRRGLVAWVEKPGSIAQGAGVKAHLPEQWIYR